jgi:hypothetical protein
MIRYVKQIAMRIDWLLLLRLGLSAVFIIEGNRNQANVDISIGVGLAIYSILAARFKLGCGYGSCSVPGSANQMLKKSENTN